MTPAAALSVASHFGFPIDNFEDMHQFNLDFTEGSSIIKYRLSSERGVTRKILTK